MVSALSLGCALVLYDGSPLIPSPATLWNLIDELKITIFGTGAKWLAVLEEKVRPPSQLMKKSVSINRFILNCFMIANDNTTAPPSPPPRGRATDHI